MTRDELMNNLQVQRAKAQDKLMEIEVRHRDLEKERQYHTGVRHGIEFALDHLKQVDQP